MERCSLPSDIVTDCTLTARRIKSKRARTRSSVLSSLSLSLSPSSLDLFSGFPPFSPSGDESPNRPLVTQHTRTTDRPSNLSRERDRRRPASRRVASRRVARPTDRPTDRASVAPPSSAIDRAIDRSRRRPIRHPSSHRASSIIDPRSAARIPPTSSSIDHPRATRRATARGDRDKTRVVFFSSSTVRGSASSPIDRRRPRAPTRGRRRRGSSRSRRSIGIFARLGDRRRARRRGSTTSRRPPTRRAQRKKIPASRGARERGDETRAVVPCAEE